MTNKINLQNKTIVITGGGGVLCGTFAKALATHGAKVAILDLSLDAAKQIATQITQNGGQALAIQTDILKKSSLLDAQKIMHEKFGPCDILINGAGGNHPKGTTSKEFFESGDLDQKDLTTFFDLDEQGIQFVFNLNFLGTLLTTQVFAQDMLTKKDATIINISSMNAFTPLTKIPAYSAAKAAISNFTQWLAVHFSKTNIRVNAIAPGFFLTEQNKKLLLDDKGNYTARAEKIINQTPMHRFGEPEELIGTLLWLIDQTSSSFVNGIIVPIDGGFSAYSGV
jgi:NAD(P)-dependent dehydrogenase (short-subunit alcohol dehydrogenase family)